MTQEIKTEKFEGLLVKQPNWAIDTGLRDEGRTISFGFDNGISREYSALPDGEWKLIGNPFEMSEEDCTEIMPIDTAFLAGFIHDKERFEELLKSLQVYKENPYVKPADDDYSFYTDRNISVQEEWQAVEERTGNWVLIQKIG